VLRFAEEIEATIVPLILSNRYGNVDELDAQTVLSSPSILVSFVIILSIFDLFKFPQEHTSELSGTVLFDVMTLILLSSTKATSIRGLPLASQGPRIPFSSVQWGMVGVSDSNSTSTCISPPSVLGHLRGQQNEGNTDVNHLIPNPPRLPVLWKSTPKDIRRPTLVPGVY
jgi:hypothetical protein